MALFKELELQDSILKALEEQGYHSPTPIQEQAIPIALQGTDILGCAQTGTGKTAAFALPIIQRLCEEKVNDKQKKIRSLILTPTRELAVQILESFEVYGKYTNLNYAVIFGGVSQFSQTQTLRKGVDVLIATPGRLLDLINQGYVHLNQVKVFVLDEADRMLDMGFVNDVKRIIQLIPSKRQTLFFSATMPKEIVKLADSILHQPKKVEVTPVSSTAETIKQELFYVDKGNKIWLLIHLIKDLQLSSVLIFTRTKHGADKVVRMLDKQKIKAQAIHGNKSQNARQNALNQFKEGGIQALIATDIAARGIDVDKLQYVINYEIPNQAETYVHRIGRTGRAGNSGTAYSLCDFDEKAYIKDIEKLIGLKIPEASHNPFPMTDFTPSAKPAQQQGRRRPGGNATTSAPAFGNNNGRNSAPKQKGVPKNKWFRKAGK